MGTDRPGRRAEVGPGALTPAEGSTADQGRLLDPDTLASGRPQHDDPPPLGRVVRVLPDVAAIDRVFDYEVPEAWETDGRADRVVIGSVVRIDLHGRRVGGWVVDVDVEPPPG